MKLLPAAKAARGRLSDDSRRGGDELLASGGPTSVTVRFETEGRSVAVVVEAEGRGLRSACTCGEADCAHVAAALATLAGECSVTGAEAPPEALATVQAESPREEPPPASASRPSLGAVADSVDQLVRAVCADGLDQRSPARDEALERLLPLLADRDLPDLRRATATLRRELAAESRDVTTAATALIQLGGISEALRKAAGGREGLASRLSLPRDADRREEVRLLEVARDSQRTPFGDRRDVSYFIDVGRGELLREHAASKPGQAPRMSEGPFPKLLVGNLVAVEPGLSPRRVRLLQYTTGGFPTSADLERIRTSAALRVADLYQAYRRSLDGKDPTHDPVVLFSPDAILASSRGVVLSDESGALLPLARGSAPELCEAVDLLARRGRIATVVGPLVLGPRFLSILPLSVLVDRGGSLSLSQLR